VYADALLVFNNARTYNKLPTEDVHYMANRVQVRGLSGCGAASGTLAAALVPAALVPLHTSCTGFNAQTESIASVGAEHCWRLPCCAVLCCDMLCVVTLQEAWQALWRASVLPKLDEEIKAAARDEDLHRWAEAGSGHRQEDGRRLQQTNTHQTGMHGLCVF
jgi:hypothetical protein